MRSRCYYFIVRNTCKVVQNMEILDQGANFLRPNRCVVHSRTRVEFHKGQVPPVTAVL